MIYIPPPRPPVVPPQSLPTLPRCWLYLLFFCPRAQMRPSVLCLWTETTTWNATTVRTVVWSSMMRMAAAATHWRTTCSVTPAMSRDWRKGPHPQPSPSTTSSQRHSGDAGQGCPGSSLRSTLGPQSWYTGRRGPGGQVPVCVEGSFPLTTAVCTPHPVHVFFKCFSPLPHPRQITQEDVLAQT